MKKILAVTVALIIAFSAVIANAYTIKDAYDEFSGEYPEFISQLETQSIDEKVLVPFLTDVLDYMREINAKTKITESNFEKYAINALSAVSSREKHLKIQDGLIILFPNAIKEALVQGTVPDEFQPLIKTIKKIVFEHKMLETDKNSGSGGGGSSTKEEEDSLKYIIASAKNLLETVVAGENYTLPETLEFTTLGGESVSATINWRGSVNTTKPGTYTVRGIIVIPKGYILNSDMTNAIEYTVVARDPNAERFTDIDSSFWGYKAICTLADNFILNGYLDGSFKPDANITRAEFAKIIVSAAGKFDIDASAEFNDVSSDVWYYSYVASAVKNGYIKGYPDGSFKPDANITRADICTVVYRAVKNKLKKKESTKFSDDLQIADYAREGVYALYANEIIGGMGDGRFAPIDFATRAQTAKIIYSAFFE